MSEETPTFELSEVIELAPEDLTEEHKVFLEEHKTELTTEQVEKFGIQVEKKEESVDDQEIETRTKVKAKEDEDVVDKDKEDDEIDPFDAKAIKKIVNKEIDPIRKENQALKDQIEVDSFITSKPEYAKYKPVILKYMQHDAYSQIPVHNIAAMVASKDLMSMGAQKEREAQRKVAETKSPGNSVRTTTTGKDWHNAPKEDFDAQRTKVMGH